MKRADRYLLLAFALGNAILYSSLLPLWEGFDEPWHYGYAQSLAITHRLPVLGETRLSQEIWDSMLSSPASHVVANAWPDLQTFDRYFTLSQADRVRERNALEAIPGTADIWDSAHTNYEAQQPPLAYLLLAGPELLLRRAPMPTRILWLRIFNASLASLIVFLAANGLFRTLGLPAIYRNLGAFCIFACQMYWAATAHLANDALGVALSVWFLAACASFSEHPSARGAVWLAVATSLGLLTKAYFLPLLLVAFCIVGWRQLRALPLFGGIVLVLAAPWYVRNVLLYHNLSGLLMTSDGSLPAHAVSSLARVNWSRTIPYMLRATLWTGNNSFTSFSSITLNLLLALFAAGLAMYCVRATRRGVTPAEWSLAGFLAVFGVAVIAVVVNDVTFLAGASAGAAPWYTIVFLPPSLALILVGVSQSGRAGRWIAMSITLLLTYICFVTYLIKLIPLYGGYPKGRTTLAETVRWYWNSSRDLTGMLTTISLAPPLLIYLETAFVLTICSLLAVRLVRGLTKLNEN